MKQIELVLQLRINELLCATSDMVLNICAFILTLIGVILSCISIRQVLLARKDIAYNHVKIKQVEVTNKLLQYLNGKNYFIYVLTIDETGNVVKQKHFNCNIFEFGNLLNDFKDPLDSKSKIFITEESRSIIDVYAFQSDGFIDVGISNALSLFQCNPKNQKLDYSKFKNQIIIIFNNSEKQSLMNLMVSSIVFEIQNGNLNTAEKMKHSIFQLKESIIHWYKNNKLNNCNIRINPYYMKPIIERLESNEQ